MEKTPIQELLAWIGEKELKPIADHIRKEFLPKEKEFIGEAFDAGMEWEDSSYPPISSKAVDKTTFLNQLYKDK